MDVSGTAPRMRRIAAWIALVAFVAIAGAVLAAHRLAPAIRNPTDFRAFYCAGQAVLARADPYRVQPIGGCEARVLASLRLQWFPGLVVPAPQPPYALALFALFGSLDFVAASALWFALAIAAWLRAALLLRDLTGLGLATVVAATFGLGLFASLGYGQLMPLATWAIVEVAAALRRGEDGRAAAFATLGAIEPHVGAPVFLALAIFRPGARRGLAIGAAALVCVSLAAVGPAVAWEWFARVLPAHADAELRNAEQFGLTSPLVSFGVSPALAHALAALQYAGMVALALVCAGRLRANLPDESALALVPPAFVVLGGPFVHEHQLAAAVPMALLGWARLRRPAFAIAIGLLAWPWLSLAEGQPQIHEIFWRWQTIVIPHAPPDALAEVPWSQFIGSFAPSAATLPLATLLKAPQWLGLGCVVVAVVRASLGGPLADRRSRREADENPPARAAR